MGAGRKKSPSAQRNEQQKKRKKKARDIAGHIIYIFLRIIIFMSCVYQPTHSSRARKTAVRGRGGGEPEGGEGQRRRFGGKREKNREGKETGGVRVNEEGSDGRGGKRREREGERMK